MIKRFVHKKRTRLNVRVLFCFWFLCPTSDFVVAAQNVDKFVFYALFNEFPSRAEVLSGIEVGGVFCEVLSDCGREGKAQIGVDVDFADGHGSCFSEHIFGYAFCAGHGSAVLIDHFHVFGNDGRSAVQHDGEFGKAFADFFKDIESQSCFAFEFKCAVGSADGDGEGVDARFGDEFLDLIGVGVASVFGGDVYVVFDAGKAAEFRLNDYAVVVRVLNHFGSAFDVSAKE